MIIRSRFRGLQLRVRLMMMMMMLLRDGHGWEILGGRDISAGPPSRVPAALVPVMMMIVVVVVARPLLLLPLPVPAAVFRRRRLQKPWAHRPLGHVFPSQTPRPRRRSTSTRTPSDDDPTEIIPLGAIEFLLLGQPRDLGLQLLDVAARLHFLFLAALPEAVGGGGVALAFLVSDFGRGLHVDGHVDGARGRVERVDLVGAGGWVVVLMMRRMMMGGRGGGGGAYGAVIEGGGAGI